MIRPFRRVATALALLLIALLANLSWVQVLEADSLRTRPGNARTVLEQFNRARGPIIVGSRPIATSSRAGADGFYQRSYANGPLYAGITGYYSLLYGATGIERSQDGVLSGTDPRFFVDRVQQLFAGRHQAGGAVTLSVDAAAQRAAFDGLAARRGATIAIDAHTGAILALVSAPAFDPQVLAPNDPAQVRNAYAALSSDPAHPLLNRAIGVTYAAGSTFQLVAAAAALASNRFRADTVLPGPARLGTIATSDGRPCGTDGRVTLARALETHCATAFASLGNAIGGDALRGMATHLGFGTTPMAELTTTQSVIATRADSTRLAAIGRGASTTVLQLAMVAAAIANRGTLMDPYIVEDVRAQDLAVLDHASPTVRATVLSHRDADALTTMLRGIDGVTGCTECSIGNLTVHAVTSDTGWFVGFAGHIAIATVVEGAHGADAARAAAMPVLRAILARTR